MVLPALYDALHSQSRADFAKYTPQRRRHGSGSSSGDRHKSKQLTTKTPSKQSMMIRRCVTPRNQDTSETTRPSSHARVSFPNSDDVDTLSYTYSVGPFAHVKSEGTMSLSSTTSTKCWMLQDFTTASATNESLLGTGKFGSVQLHHTRSIGKVALKILDKSNRQDQSMWKREVEIQTRYVCLAQVLIVNGFHTLVFLLMSSPLELGLTACVVQFNSHPWQTFA